MRKSLLWLLVVVLSISMIAVFSLAGCKKEAVKEEAAPAEEEATEEAAPAEEEKVEKFTIAVVPPALISPYFITLADAAEESAAKFENIELLVLAAEAETAFEQQVNILEDLIQKKVDLIAVSSANWDAVTPPLKKAIDNGIEVVLIDKITPVEGVDAVSMLGVDEIKGGELVGEYVVELLEGEGRVAILEGVAGDYWSERRTQGFHNIVDEYPGIEIATTQPANWERERGMSVMENILQAHRDLDLVWGLNDNMALGAAKAIEDAGLQEEIMVIGYNADKEAVEAVSEGILKATVAQQPAKIAQTIVEDIAVKLIKGEREQIEPVIYIPVQLVTSDNVEEFLSR